MLRFLLLVDLFRWLPWWGAVSILVFLAIGFWALGQYFFHKLQRELTGAILHQGDPLRDAVVDVHSVEPADAPTGPPLMSLDPDDENYDPDLDGLDVAEGTDYFWIEATISPHDPTTTWDPTALDLVQRDFDPGEEFEVCEEAGELHTLEVWRNGDFVPCGESNLTGPQRLRMLCGVPQTLRQAKFAYHFTCFGSFELPSPVEASS